MDWPSYLWGAISGLVVGAVLVYVSEFVRPIARRHEKGFGSWRIKRRQARESRKRQREEEEHRRRLEEERIGARFRWRANPDDPGMVGVVVGVSGGRSSSFVKVEWSNPPGRAPTSDDYSQGSLWMEWRQLVKSEAEQRHWSARILRDSDDDAAGWVMYERLPDPE